MKNFYSLPGAMLITVLFIYSTVNAQWSKVGNGTEAIIIALTDYQDKLFAAGYFYYPLPYPHALPFLQSWHDGNWHEEVNGLNPSITYLLSLEVFNNKLYAGGDLGIGIYNGSNWSTSGGQRADVMAIYKDQLYAGGYELYHLDGTSWKKTDTMDYPFIHEIEVYNDELYVCGDFNSINGIPFNHLAKWNGSVWSSVGDGLPETEGVDMAVYKNELYFGGDFLQSEGYPSSYIMKWDGNAWLPVGSGADGPVTALDSAFGYLFAGGDFTMIDSVAVNKIAEYDGEWHPMGSGIEPSYARIKSIYPYNHQVYVGGDMIEKAGGLSVNNIARWGYPSSVTQIASESSFTIYPNPASSLINLKLTSLGNSTLIIMDSYGKIYKKIYLIASGEQTIQLEGLPDGIYCATLSNDKQQFTTKFIIAR